LRIAMRGVANKGVHGIIHFGSPAVRGAIRKFQVCLSPVWCTPMCTPARRTNRKS